MADIINKGTTREPIESLHPAERNPNMGDVQRIRISIRDNGFFGSILARESTREILAGNHTWKAAQLEGLEAIDVTWVQVDDATARRILLADNATRDHAEYDYTVLAELLSETVEHDNANLNATGYFTHEVDDVFAKADALIDEQNEAREPITGPDMERDELENLLIDWPTERGDVWEFPTLHPANEGHAHLLMCGSCLDDDERAVLLEDVQPRVLWSDPPYGLGGYKGRKYKGRPDKHVAVEGDDADEAQLREFFAAGAELAPERYVWCNYKVYHLLVQALGVPRSCIVWGKNNFTMGRGYRRQHEWLAYWGSLDLTDERDLWTNHKQLPGGHYNHPTQKPPSLAARAIKNSSAKSAVVYSPFSGSGDAFIAAELTGRICHGFELAPEYCALICETIAQEGIEPRKR